MAVMKEQQEQFSGWGSAQDKNCTKGPSIRKAEKQCSRRTSTDSREAQRHSPKVRPPINLLVGVNFRKNMHSLFSKARVNGYIKFF